MCNSHLPVRLSNGYGHPNTNPDSVNYFNISLTSRPVTVDLNHDGIKDTAAVFECDDGGTVYTTELWVFDAKPSGFRALAGPMYPRPGTGLGCANQIGGGQRRRSSRFRDLLAARRPTLLSVRCDDHHLGMA